MESPSTVWEQVNDTWDIFNAFSRDRLTDKIFHSVKLPLTLDFSLIASLYLVTGYISDHLKLISLPPLCPFLHHDGQRVTRLVNMPTIKFPYLETVWHLTPKVCILLYFLFPYMWLLWK